MAKKIKRSKHTYIIYAERKTSQFNQKRQEMRCVVLEAHRSYLIVESLKRYNKKYEGKNVAKKGKYVGIPIRRINKNQAGLILDERTGKWIAYETVRRREGTNKPGRARGGK